MAFHFALWSLAGLVAAYQKNDKIPAVLPREQFFSYVTRPDLLVPRWNVTVYDQQALSEGYWFTAPYDELRAQESTKPYVGPAIYDGNGDLIWSPGARFHNADVHDFKVSMINGRQYLSWISLYDQAAVILDGHYNEAKRQFIGKADEHANMHEFNLIEDGSRALLFFHNFTQVSKAESATVGFDGRCNVMSHTIEEADTSDWENWKPVFKWNMLDHISVNESTMGRDQIDQKCSNKYDFLHANAVDKCPDGNLLLSNRNSDALYKINRQDGSIMWRLGGLLSDFDADFVFSRQHHVRCRGTNETHTMLSFLDNANAADHTHPYSRGLMVAVDEVQKTAHALTEYPHPHKEITSARGSCELLDNGNVMMGWSIRSLISEHTANGRIIMEAQTVPDWLVSYRSYKFPWVGRPQHSPDVVSRVQTLESRNSTVTIVFASWNGATEVRYWNLYKTDRSGETRQLVATVPRNGFETQMIYQGFASNVVVEALDVHGNPLDYGRTPVIKTKAPSKLIAPPEFEEAKEQETQWLQHAEFEKDHPWVTEAKQAATTPWGMFAAGVLACFGVGIGVWLGWKVLAGQKALGGKTSWWRASSYYALSSNDDNDAEKGDYEAYQSSEGSRGSCSKDSVYAPQNDHDIRQ